MDFFTRLSRFSGTLKDVLVIWRLFCMTMTAAYSKSARARSQNQGRNFGITAGGGV